MINRGFWSGRRKRFRSFSHSTNASITLEAAMILPLIMMFVMLLISMIRIASTELALRSAVAETSRSIAGYWSPVRMVYADAKTRVMESKAGVWAQDALSRVDAARSQWTGAEDWVMQYEALLPDAVIDLLKWEMEKREELEGAAEDKTKAAVQRVTDPLLCQAFEPILHHYSNGRLLRKERLKVEAVRLPSFEPGGSPYVEITASYRLTLPVPFLHKTVVLKKTSYERAWVGDE